MKRQSLIDAVIITSREARRHSDFDGQFANEKSRILLRCLREYHGEDSSLWFVPEHSVRTFRVGFSASTVNFAKQMGGVLRPNGMP
jgi:hypothetical protein